MIARLALVAMTTLGATLSPAGAEVVTQTEFVESWIAALEASDKGYEIETAGELETTAKAGGLTIRASAEQAYAGYLAEPDSKDQQIDSLLSMVHEAFETAAKPPDLSRIVPVIHHSDWLAEYRLDCPYYPLPGDLIAVLAEDLPEETRYLRTADLERLDKTVPELFTTAIGNLRRVAPIEEHDFDQFVILSSGGNYEAGLMLDAGLIARYQDRFVGEIVFAVPSGDAFIVTGREEQQGLGGIVRAVCAGIDPAMALSSKIFTAGDGALEIAGEIDCNGEQPVLTLH